MRHLFKPHIEELVRYRTSEGRDLEGLRLDRNERVEPLPEDVVRDMFARFRPCDLAAHPDSEPLYRKLADYTGQPRERIYASNGITEGIKFLYETLGGPGGNVVCLDPTYPMYMVYAGFMDIEYRKWTYGPDLKPDMAALEQAVDQDTFLVILPNPNLPVEFHFSPDEVRELARFCRDKGAALAVDEAYTEFSPGSAVDLVEEFDNLVVLRTFSKAFGLASARLGYMISQQQNIDYISKTRSMVEANTYSMGLACYMLDHLDMVQAHIRQVKEGAAFLHKELDRLGLRWHGGRFTNGILIFLDGRGDPDECIKELQEQKIYIRGAFAPPFNTCVRVSIGARPAMERFLAAFETWLGR